MHLQNIEPLLSALLYSAIFYFGSRIPMPREGERFYRRVISLSAGVGVAYVFLGLLPELNVAREILLESAEPHTMLFEQYRVYLGALSGFIAFYGVHHLLALTSKGTIDEGVWRAGNWPFLLYVSVFFLYVGLVTYFKVNSLEEVHGSRDFYTIAMGFHLFLIDYSLRREYGELYLKRVKNVLAAAPLLGWMVGMYVIFPVTVVIPLAGVIAGGIIMNTMLMEMPRDTQSRFPYFLMGAVLFSAVILAFH
ncbi:hypothetical protein MUP29_11040 [bacterium]|nr:hypothetical protein [bacterium]